MIHKAFIRAHELATRCRSAAETGLRAGKNEKRGSLYIYAPIGASFWGDSISAKDVASKLEEMKGVDALDIFINSEGGDVFDGKAIYTALKRFDAKKTVYVDGIAASIATVIAMAGDRIVTAAGATWMIHQPWGFAMGNAADMRSTADVLDMERDNIVDTYARRTNGDRAQILDWVNAETWMTAAQAKERGFTDEVTEGNEMGCDCEGECGDDCPCGGNCTDACECDCEPVSAAAARAMPRIAAALRVTERRVKAARDIDVVLARQAQRLRNINDSRRASPAPQHAGMPAPNAAKK